MNCEILNLRSFHIRRNYKNIGIQMALNKNQINKQHHQYNVPSHKFKNVSYESSPSIVQHLEWRQDKSYPEPKATNSTNHINNKQAGSSKRFSTGLISFKHAQNTDNFSPDVKGVHHIKQSKVRKKPTHKKHGYIYNSSSNIPLHHRTESEESEIKNLQDENTKLRAKLVDCELRQRENVERINNLEKRCLNLEQLVSKRKTMTKQQQQFLTVLKSTFSQCFGIDQYKQIWKMQKNILQEWMNSKIQQTKPSKSKKKIASSSKIHTEQPQIKFQQSIDYKNDKNVRIKIDTNSRAKIRTEQESSSSSENQ